MEIISLFPSFTVHPSPVSLSLEFSLPSPSPVALYTHRHECSPEMTTKVDVVSCKIAKPFPVPVRPSSPILMSLPLHSPSV